MFPSNSRYKHTETAEWKSKDGRVIVYLQRRFLPQPDSIPAPMEHLVKDDERLDNLAANYLGDPLVFWRICDANICLHPDELTAKEGRILRIPLSLGGG